MKNDKVQSILATSKEVFNFITDEYLQKRILLQCFINSDFNEYVLKQITRLKRNVSAEMINNVFDNIHAQTVKYLTLAKKCLKPSSRYGNYILLSLSYFYLLESLDEHCRLNDNIIKKIKKHFGDNYLKVISSVDKTFLSNDMKNIQAIRKNDDYLVVDLNEEVIKQYITFKRWQDKQHSFYFDEIEKFSFDLLKQCFPAFANSKDLENDILNQGIFEILRKNKIVDIDIICLLTELNFKKELLNLFGGKAYGLAKLKSIDIEIPWTAVIPTLKSISYEQLDNFIPPEIQYFSVRSSADIEDGENHSFAGMFDSYLNVNRKDLVGYITKVKNSVKNKRLKSYLIKNNLENPHIAVVIQEFKEPQKSGVWIGNSLNSGVLEYTDGNGEKLVSGKIVPKREIWKKDFNKETAIKINEKFIGESLIGMQKKLGTVSDFEWMILNNKLIMLQFRPVTVKLTAYKPKQISSNSVITGLACSPGRITGTVQFLNSPKEKFQTGNILLAWITDPDWLPHIINAKGVITASGGFLCHAGIICRELGIPCVTGVGGDIIKRLSIEDEIKVILDGDKGTITIK